MMFLDWTATEAKARKMSASELVWAIADCREAAQMAWEIEKAGNPVSKTQGYYHDEASVYHAELKRRAGLKKREDLIPANLALAIMDRMMVEKMGREVAS